MNKCRTCGSNCVGEYCFAHKPRKKLSSNTALKKTKLWNISSKKKENGDNIQQMQQFFLKIWDKRKHYSEISNTYLGSEPLSTFFHHIIYKESYPELMYNEDNIILLTLDEHSNTHIDKFRYEEINKRREKLVKKYELS